MIIINATSSQQTFMLQSGEQISVAPGKTSGVFLGDEAIVKSILQSGLSCNEIGIVVGSTSEYELCRKAIPAGMNQMSKSGDVVNYVYTDERAAVAKLLEGKDFSPTIANSPNAVLDMQLKLDKKDEEIEKLKKKIKELKVEAEQAKAAVEPLEKANSELNKKIIEANGNVEEVNEINITLRDKIKDLNTENKQLLENRSGLEKVITENNEVITTLNKNIDLLKTEGKKCLNENEELRAILNDVVKTYDLEKVEEDGKTVLRMKTK